MIFRCASFWMKIHENPLNYMKILALVLVLALALALALALTLGPEKKIPAFFHWYRPGVPFTRRKVPREFPDGYRGKP